MIRWLLGRSAQAVVTMLVAMTLLFFLMRAAPGDPVALLAGERLATPEELARLRERYGFDRPVLAQFATFVAQAARGNLGTSVKYHGRPVTALIAERLPRTLLLGVTVLLFNFTVGIWLGAWQAVHKDRPGDRLLSTVSLVGYAMPSFWLGLLLIWVFALHWRLLPTQGIIDPLLSPDAGTLTRALDVLRHLVLPALTLSVVSVAATMRHQRSAMLEVLRLDFVRTARAKGLPERQVLRRHAWRNALFPVLTLFGLWLPVLATGSVYVEYVFSWAGLGQLAAEAISWRDYNVLMGTGLLVSALVVLGGLLTDVAYQLLDPRVRAR